jgi:hypothetical protein
MIYNNKKKTDNHISIGNMSAIYSRTLLKKFFKFMITNKQIISYLLSYLIILFISSYHFFTTILINLILIVNFIKLILNNNNNNNHENTHKNLNYFVYSLLIGNYLVFQTMVYSYREILGWELAILILINLLFIYYLYYLKKIKTTNIITLNQYNKFLQFNNTTPKPQPSNKLFVCRL